MVTTSLVSGLHRTEHVVTANNVSLVYVTVITLIGLCTLIYVIYV